MELSVIIVSYNVRYYLEQCLLSVRTASEGIDSEVFVVDNNSADGSCSMVSTLFPDVKLIMNRDNKGFAAANNQALKLATGRYMLLLNPDTIVEEDTFKRCISFMDEHTDAGATGVRMIDGKGRMLPESKRALPTPKTAFFKMTGLSYIFPKSHIFNRYYLGHLDDLETTRADIISGAFMFLRREAVLKTGFLDETFFMYGEDVDYSYRLQKEGYYNYYFPEIKIIHYKGESTKKENLNVLINFYKSMIIFVRKHFANGSLKAFTLLIQVAIFFRAALSLFNRFIKKIFFPLTDGILIYLIFRLATSFWGAYKYGEGYRYPDTFIENLIPAYTIIILLSIVSLSGYKIPVKPVSAVKGVITGTILILIVYALLPLNLRFSRAIIITGGLFSVFLVPLWRLLVSFTGFEIADNPFSKTRKTIIVSDPEGYSRIKNLMSSSGIRNKVAGRVSIRKDDMKEEVLGNIEQVREVIRINNIKEIIFATRDLSASQVIDSMHIISDLDIKITIASADESYILGSRYVNPEEDIAIFRHTSFFSGIMDTIKNLFS